MTHTLWETDSRNSIGCYALKAEALAFVRAQVEDCGKESTETWTLGVQADERRVKSIASGYDLVAKALNPVIGHAVS